MFKELPIVTPPKTSHLFLALPLSIIMVDDNMWSWYYTEFIQMLTFRSKDDMDNKERVHIIPYHNGPMDMYDPLECCSISPFELKIGADIINMYKQLINADYYINTYCDDFYISTMDVPEHRFHEILFYGYDDDAKAFMAYAYNGLKLKKFYVLYEDYLKAYFSEYLEGKGRATVLYRRKNTAHDINLEKLKWHLLDYMECVDTQRRERPYDVSYYKGNWGFDIYDEINNMYEMHVENDWNISGGGTYCLLEHKKDLLDGANFFNEKTPIRCTEDILNDFTRVKNEAYRIMNLVLKINQKKRINVSRDLEMLKSQVTLVKDLEMSALDKYYKYNKSAFDNI